MPRRPAPDSWLAPLYTYFGLRAYELAQYLGIDAGQLSRVASGQRSLGPAVQESLAAFVAYLPPEPEVAGPGLLTLPSAARAPLEARLDYCQHHARRLRRVLRPLEARARVSARWAVALPRLQAALPPDPGPAAAPDATDWPAWHTWFRHRWLSQRPTALPPEQSARYHLLRLQAEALETEAAALQGLLQPPVADS